jgi:hypothetical protein
MANNRALAATFAVLLVGWFMLRHTLGFYNPVAAFFRWQDFVTYLLVLIFTPAVMWKVRWTALGALVVGAIRIVVGIIGLYTSLVVAPSLAYGPAVAVVLALLMTYFSFRAYQEK